MGGLLRGAEEGEGEVWASSSGYKLVHLGSCFCWGERREIFVCVFSGQNVYREREGGGGGVVYVCGRKHTGILVSLPLGV